VEEYQAFRQSYKGSDLPENISEGEKRDRAIALKLFQQGSAEAAGEFWLEMEKQSRTKGRDLAGFEDQTTNMSEKEKEQYRERGEKLYRRKKGEFPDLFDAAQNTQNNEN